MSTKLSRRNFLALAGLGGASLLASGSAQAANFTTDVIETVHTDVTLARLPQAFDGYRIGLISDIHYGAYVPQSWVVSALESLVTADVDMLLLAGDFSWVPGFKILPYSRRNPAIAAERRESVALKRIHDDLGELFSTISPADGIYAVYGNHDRWNGVPYCQRMCDRSALRFLTNEALLVERDTQAIELYGLDDYWTGIPALPTEATEHCRVILTHNPDVFALLEREQCRFDLGLAGHTHGGQVHLPGLGALTYNVSDLRFKQGLYQGRDFQTYTTAGLGVVEIPYRINCPAEVSVLNLHSG